MPEAAAIFFVLTVSLGVIVYAGLQALDPAKRNLEADRRQLRHQHAWLTEQLAQAKRENWDQQMIARLTDQLDDATRKLGKPTRVTTEVADEVTRPG